MDLIVILLVCVVIGFVTWLLTTQIPMPPVWAKALQVLVLIILVIWVLSRLIALPNVLPK